MGSILGGLPLYLIELPGTFCSLAEEVTSILDSNWLLTIKFLVVNKY